MTGTPAISLPLAWNADDLWGGVRYIGPFYVMPVMLPIVLCGARGLVDLWNARRSAGALAGVATVAATGCAATGRGSVQHHA